MISNGMCGVRHQMRNGKSLMSSAYVNDCSVSCVLVHGVLLVTASYLF